MRPACLRQQSFDQRLPSSAPPSSATRPLPAEHLPPSTSCWDGCRVIIQRLSRRKQGGKHMAKVKSVWVAHACVTHACTRCLMAACRVLCFCLLLKEWAEASHPEACMSGISLPHPNPRNACRRGRRGGSCRSIRLTRRSQTPSSAGRPGRQKVRDGAAFCYSRGGSYWQGSDGPTGSQTSN